MPQVRHATLTLDGTQQLLSSALTPRSLPHQIALQPDGANANPIYLGGPDSAVTSSDYGFRLEAAVTGIPPAPYILEAITVNLAQLKVLGTVGEKLHILEISE